jgi:subtilase family serine protease
VRNRRTAFLRVMLALTVLSGCGASGHSSRPSSSPAAGSSTTFTPLNLGLPKDALSAPVTGRLPDGQTLHVGVTLKISDATWKKFGHGKSTSQGVKGLARQLGVGDDELRRLNAYFAEAHVQAKPSKTRTSLTFDVKAGEAGRLLKTSFVTHRLKGRSYFTPDPAHMPVVPTQIAGYILSVTGLDSYSVAPVSRAGRPGELALTGPARAGLTRANPPGTSPARAGNCGQFPPRAATYQKIASAYGYDRFWAQGWHGENMTVNLVEMDGYDLRDVQTYAACTGSHVAVSNVNLGATSPPPGAEATLDIEMLAGLAPGVRIVDYQEDPALLNTGYGSDSWTAFNAALQRIIDDNSENTRPGSVVSISLGGAEGFMSQATMQAIDQSLRILTQVERMTVFVATRRVVPVDVAVGGRCRRHPDAVRRGRRASGGGGLVGPLEPHQVREPVGSGGGVSRVFRRPGYQVGPGVINRYSTGFRQVPDVAAAAIDLPVFYRGQWNGFGGTSAATPIWAAGMVLVNQGLMARKQVFWYGPDTLYHVIGQGGANTPYYDVVTGNNLYYPATAGYDLSTGLGTPNAANIYNILLNSPV